MKTHWMFRTMVALTLTTALTGCVVFPTHVHVPDAADGELVYERCSLNPTVPVGVRIARPGLHATVSIVKQRDASYVAVQYDLPEHHTLALRQDTIAIDARDGRPPMLAPIPSVNPSGPGYFDFPALRKHLLPVDTELQGGRIGLASALSDRHYWIAGRIAGDLADDVWITLPRFALDGVEQEFSALHFDRQFMIARGLFNC